MKRTNPNRAHQVSLYFREDEFSILKRIAARDRRKHTRWCKEAVWRALRRATRDEVAA